MHVYCWSFLILRQNIYENEVSAWKALDPADTKRARVLTILFMPLDSSMP